MRKRFWKSAPDTKNNRYNTHSMRFFEIDAARGAAIILMILFHAAFDLKYVGVYNLDFGWFFWYMLPRAIATIFIILAGISLTLNYNRSKKDAATRFSRRGLTIFSFGLAITLTTYIFFPEGTILFGILHFIGISTVLSLPFLEMREKGFFLGLLAAIAGFYLQTMRFDFPWLLWLGFMPSNFYTFDYFPIFPWFGFILLGIHLGNRFYTNGKRIFRINEPQSRFIGLLALIGKKPLIIYLLHQPLLVLLITALR